MRHPALAGYRPTWAEIDLKVFRENLKSISSYVGRNAKILAVVKADAYGHSAVDISKALKNNPRIYALGVSSIEEGVQLRSSGIKSRILILGSIYPFSNLSACVRYGLTPTVSSFQGLVELDKLGSKLGKRIPFHLKIDTGMGRVGISAKNAEGVIKKISENPHVLLDGIYTHFSSADSDKEFTLIQLKKFSFAVQYAKKLKMKFCAHAANSSAMIKYKNTLFDCARPGLALYGMLPFDGADRLVALEPVLSWKTRIVFLKKAVEKMPVSYSKTFIAKKGSVIATLPVGYADGYMRSLSNKGIVLIRGRRCPVVGRVTMDMIMVDVTGVPGVSIGDEAVLLGRQGKESVTAEELARLAGTINYEITCAISRRVPRLTVDKK